MIYLINYSDNNFESQRRHNTSTAYSKGKVDKVIEYSPEDIDDDFKKRNERILSYQRGAGLWLWKPYIIQKTLKMINENDYIIYCDAGAVFVDKVQYLIDILELNKISIMLFELPLLQRQFTKRETFHLMEYYDYSGNQIMAGLILLKKGQNSIDFINEWLNYMCDERIVSPNHFLPEIEEFSDFYSHREDQSVLSILARKHHLPFFRDPSDFGERPWQYARNQCTYSEKIYSNSPYPKIIICNRKSNPIVYKYKEKIKTILNKLDIYTKEYYFKKYNIGSYKIKRS